MKLGLFLVLLFTMAFLPACTRPKDTFTGNAEAYSGLRPREGSYYWMDSRASCQKNGVTIAGYRGVIEVTHFGPMKFKKACDDTYTKIQDGNVQFSAFGKLKIGGSAVDQVIIYNGGLFDRMSTTPQAGSTNFVWTRSFFQVTLAGETYETVVRSQGASDAPVNAQAYLIKPDGTPVLNVPVVSTINENVRNYIGTDFNLEVRTVASSTTASLQTKVNGLNESGDSSDGVDNTVTPPPPSESRVPLLVAAGAGFSCSARYGQAFCWGFNDRGQLGIGGLVNKSRQTPLSAFPSAVTMLSAGGTSACALHAGSAACWGANDLGQVGNGNFIGPVDQPSYMPLASPSMVSTGNTHACAIVSNRVHCWGNNSAGQLGDGTQTKRSTPTPVVGALGDVVSIATGAGHTCSLNTLGEVFCWGNNLMGQLGVGALDNTVRPPQKIPGYKFVSIAAGGYKTCGISDAGRLYCWGDNTTTVISGTGSNNPDRLGTPSLMPVLTGPVTSVSVGLSHACAIQNGVAYCWGQNALGATGQGTGTGYAPVSPVTGLSNETAFTISCGNTHTLLTTLSTIKSWGNNSYGQLGNDTLTNSSTPITVLDP